MASDTTIRELGLLFAGVLEQGLKLYGGDSPGAGRLRTAGGRAWPSRGRHSRRSSRWWSPGRGLGLPGVPQVFDDENIARILDGAAVHRQAVAESLRDRMVDMRITRLVKSETKGASFATIDDPADVIKLAGMHAPLDVVEQFGIDSARDEALDNATRLAIGGGFEALRDAGIPLVRHYKTTTLGTQLPDRWGLPDELRDDTGIVFASAFPGYESLVAAVEDYLVDRGRREQILALEAVRAT